MDYNLNECESCPLHVLYLNCMQQLSNHYLLVDYYKQELFDIILHQQPIGKIVTAISALHDYPFQ